MRILSLATIAGAALLVAACGGSSSNNTANTAPVDNTLMTNDVGMAPTDMNSGMPASNEMGNASSMGNTSSTGNSTGTNTTNAM